jgi:hypothetical protein
VSPSAREINTVFGTNLAYSELAQVRRGRIQNRNQKALDLYRQYKVVDQEDGFTVKEPARDGLRNVVLTGEAFGSVEALGFGTKDYLPEQMELLELAGKPAFPEIKLETPSTMDWAAFLVDPGRSVPIFSFLFDMY